MPKRSNASAWATSALGLDARAGSCEPHELVGVDRLARVASGAPRGEVRGDRREQVAPVERRGDRLQPVRRARDVDGLDDAAEALAPRATAAPLSGPTRSRSSSAHAQRDRAPLGADAGVDDREVHARGGRTAARAAGRPRAVRTSWRGTPCVRSMTRASGAIRAITAWQTPTKSSLSP